MRRSEAQTQAGLTTRVGLENSCEGGLALFNLTIASWGNWPDEVCSALHEGTSKYTGIGCGGSLDRASKKPLSPPRLKLDGGPFNGSWSSTFAARNNRDGINKRPIISRQRSKEVDFGTQKWYTKRHRDCNKLLILLKLSRERANPSLSAKASQIPINRAFSSMEGAA
ncbi:hypothetical protein V1291_002591 [Nitrobacteraceae bacterium AZCC 1564]